MEWNKHCYRVGSHSAVWDGLPTPATEAFDTFVAAARKRIEPWLSAVFQAEHLNLVLGGGFTEPAPVSWTPQIARKCGRSSPWPKGNGGRSRRSSRHRRCGWCGTAGSPSG
jgi:hypothetical protein